MPDDLEAIRQISGILEPFSHEEQTRIIRWVSERMGLAAQLGTQTARDKDLISALGADPRRKLRDLMLRGDIEGIKTLLPAIERLGSTDALFSAASILAASGDEQGLNLLNKILRHDDVDDEHARAAIGSMAQYYILRDQESLGLSTLGPLIERHLLRAKSPEDAAFYHNQLGRLLYGAKRFQDAADSQKKAADANPSEAAYAYNLSLVYERLGQIDLAVEYARRAIKNSTDADHISHAAELFSQVGLKSEAKTLLDQLRRLDPARAEYLTRTDSVLRQLTR